MSDGRPEASDGVWQSDDVHRRPQGVDDDTVTAVGKVSEAMEWLERARGSLYEFHQLLGHLDLQMGEGARLLSEAGHDELAALVDREAVGRNVLDGRWTFQIIEEFDDLYYRPLCAIEKRIRDELMAGRRHVFEAELKEQRRTAGLRGHEARPPSAHDPGVVTEESGARERSAS